MSQKRLNFVCVLTMGLLVFGCKKAEPPKKEMPRESSAGASGNVSAILGSPSGGMPEKAFALWTEGRQKGAEDELIKVNWSKADLFPAGSPFSLTESQIRSTPEPGRSRLINQALESQKPVRALCRSIMDSSPTSILDKKQYELSERRLQSVRGCGQALTRPDGLLVIRLVGLAIQKAALAKLATLYASNEPVKSASVETALKQLPKQ